MDEKPDERQEPREAGGKWWDATRRTFQVAGFRAGQYKRIVQKKIDLGALHRQISHTHEELGRLVDALRASGQTDLLANAEVQALLQRLDSLRHAAASLEEEIEAIRAEAPPPEAEQREEDRAP
jgi:uncharacterized membrane protein